MSEELDKTRVEGLAYEIGILVRAHLLVEPRDRITVYEVLNALAIHVGVVLAATGEAPEAMAFFLEAVNGQMNFKEFTDVLRELEKSGV